MSEMALDDYKAIIEEVQTNQLELRYVPGYQQFTEAEMQSLN